MNPAYLFIALFTGVGNAQGEIDCTSIPLWSPKVYAEGGIQVVKDGTVYTTRNWVGETTVPGIAEDWLLTGPCIEGTIYNPADHIRDGWKRWEVEEPKTTYFSPYVDTTLYVDGGKDFEINPVNRLNLGFITGGGCSAASLTWAGNDLGWVENGIAAIRARGGEVTISIGGAAGPDFASQGCNKDQIVEMVSALVDRYGTEWIDFDIEQGLESGMQVRADALVALQAKYPGIGFSFTLPILPSGLLPNALAVLAPLKNLTRKSLSIMTMCYGDACVEHEDDTECNISAAENAVAQVAPLWEQTEEEVYRNLVIIPQIGQNGDVGLADGKWEVFPVEGVQRLSDFAKSKNIRQLSMWSMTRDRSKSSCNNSYDGSGCTNDRQPAQSEDWEYARRFLENLYA